MKMSLRIRVQLNAMMKGQNSERDAFLLGQGGNKDWMWEVTRHEEC